MTEPIHIISLGAGVQSSTMSLMAACGEITPMPTAAIFADTQAEPQSVYRWLDWLEKQLPFPVYRVTAGSLENTTLTIHRRRDGNGYWIASGIPHYSLNRDGSIGHGRRQCTHDFKLTPLYKKQREIGNIKRGQNTLGVISWIGISRDEIQRMKESRVPWIEHRWPLVDMAMTRNDCLKWMQVHGFPKPPRSACVFCPYHSDSEWRRLRSEEPLEFERAVKFDEEYRRLKIQTVSHKGFVPYLHNSLKPLGEVDFSTEEERGQLNFFENECEGMCGV